MRIPSNKNNPRLPNKTTGNHAARTGYRMPILPRFMQIYDKTKNAQQIRILIPTLKKTFLLILSKPTTKGIPKKSSTKLVRGDAALE